MTQITPQQYAILKALFEYHALTSHQLHMLGIGGLQSLRRNLRALEGVSSKPSKFHSGRAKKNSSKSPSKSSLKTPLVQYQSFPPHPRLGRLQNVHLLTPRGISYLSQTESLSPVSYMNWYETDYFHRIGLIDFRIRLETALKNTSCHLSSWNTYYQRISSSSSPAEFIPTTKIYFRNSSTFVPDVLFTTQQTQGKQQLLVSVEFIRGVHVKRSVEQISQHHRAMMESVVTAKYRMPMGSQYIALFLFEEEELMNRVLLRLWSQYQAEYTALMPYFFFASVDDTKRDVLGCWNRLTDPKKNGMRYNFLMGNITYKTPALQM